MDTKPVGQSLTIWFNAVALIVGVLSLPEVVAIIPTNMLRIVVLVVAVGNLILRFRTDTPIAFGASTQTGLADKPDSEEV